MDRRSSLRLRADCPLTSFRDGHALSGRAVDLSAGGALIRHGRARDMPLVHELELRLGAHKRMRTLARTVWSRDEWQAVRFIGLSDVDRLEIAEHLDRLERRARAA